MGVVKRLSGRAKAGRGLTVFADDTFIVSYPRSGNTWLSRILGDLLDSPVTGIFDARPLAEEGLDRQGEFRQGFAGVAQSLEEDTECIQRSFHCV